MPHAFSAADGYLHLTTVAARQPRERTCNSSASPPAGSETSVGWSPRVTPQVRVDALIIMVEVALSRRNLHQAQTDSVSAKNDARWLYRRTIDCVGIYLLLQKFGILSDRRSPATARTS